ELSHQVLFDIHLTLMPGEITIMTGPSGCGKSTLVSLIGGLRTVQKGSLRIFRRELKDLTGRELVALRRDIGFIFQAHNLVSSLTASQNARMARELRAHRPREIRRRAAELLHRLGLGERMSYKPRALSGGQRQRVAVARALANHPRLILAD